MYSIYNVIDYWSKVNLVEPKIIVIYSKQCIDPSWLWIYGLSWCTFVCCCFMCWSRNQVSNRNFNFNYILWCCKLSRNRKKCDSVLCDQPRSVASFWKINHQKHHGLFASRICVCSSLFTLHFMTFFRIEFLLQYFIWPN